MEDREPVARPVSMKRVLEATLGLVVALAFPAVATALAPSASFTVSPVSPLSLEPVTFTSTSTGDVSSVGWDLDNDGSFDDSTNTSATLSFPSAAVYTVRLRAYGYGGAYGDQVQPIRVFNRPPTATIAYFPAAPKAGDPLNLVALPEDSDGTVVSEEWDLDGDGVFEASGALVTHTFPTPGAYTVLLRVTDNDHAAVVASQVIRVDAKPPEFLSPFPLVRVSGKVTVAGARINRLVIEAPSGAKVKIRCHGGGCKRRQQAKTAPSTGGPTFLRFPQFERRLRPHAVLEIFVTKPGTIGKYTRLTIRGGKRPLRYDLCIYPGAKRPRACK
jgi:PKD domain